MRIHAAALSLILVVGVAHARVWGDGSFENDDAIDWAVECTSAKSIGPISRALSIANKGKSIEAADGSAAVL